MKSPENAPRSGASSSSPTTRPILRGVTCPPPAVSPSPMEHHPAKEQQPQPQDADVPTSSTVAYTYRALYDDDDDDSYEEDLSFPPHNSHDWPHPTTRDWKIPTSAAAAAATSLTRCPSTGSLVSIEVLREMMLDRSGRSWHSGRTGSRSHNSGSSGGEGSLRAGWNSSHRSLNADANADDGRITASATATPTPTTSEGTWRLFPNVESLKQLPLFLHQRRRRGGDARLDSAVWNPFSTVVVRKRSEGNLGSMEGNWLGEEEEKVGRRSSASGRRRRRSAASAPIRMGTDVTLHSCGSSSSSSSSSSSDSDSRASRSFPRQRRSASSNSSGCDSGTSSSTGSVNVTNGWNGLTTESSKDDRTREQRKKERRRQTHSSRPRTTDAASILTDSPHNHSSLSNTNNNNDPATINDSTDQQDPLPKEVSSSSLKENDTHSFFPKGKALIQSHSDGEIAKPYIETIQETTTPRPPPPHRRASDPTSPTLSIRTTISTLSHCCPLHLGDEETKLDSCVVGAEAEEAPEAKATTTTITTTAVAAALLEEEMEKLTIDVNNNNVPKEMEKLKIGVNHNDVPKDDAHGEENLTRDAPREETQEVKTPQTTNAMDVTFVRKRSDGETTVPNHLPFPLADVLDLNAYDVIFDDDDKLKINHLQDDDQSSKPEESVRLSLRHDFDKASRRGSFQRSMSVSSGFRTSISSKSGDFGHFAAALDASSRIESQLSTNQQYINFYDHDVVDSTSFPKEQHPPPPTTSESPPSQYQRTVTPLRRRPSEESQTTVPVSTISSLASLASPIDHARAVHAQLVRSKLSHMAVAPLQRESSLESMSSLGTESVARGMGRMYKLSLDNSARRVGMDDTNRKLEGKRSEHADAPSVENEARRPPQSHGQRETRTNMDDSVDYDDLSPSRQNHDFREHSSITLGTFFSDLQKSNISEADSSEDSYSIRPDRDTCDIDSAMAAFAIATKLGHFGFVHDQVILNVNTEEDNDHVLAAKAFMGLGFAGQQKGEHESALESYMKSLQLWESEIGSDHPSLACLHYTIGTVLSQMRNELEASVHFNNALSLLKATDNNDERIRASILSTEGMIFSVLGEAGRGIDCFRKVLLLYQKFDSPFDLSYSTIIYEMGTLLAQQGDIEDSINCYKYALNIRETTLGNSFLVMQTHYSLGVTLAHDDSPSSQDYALIHLEKALALCGGDNIQAPTIIHAIGVLKEKKGDFHAAANWFYKELDMMKSLFGDDDERVGMCSSDVGSCFFQIGKYDLATVLFEQALRILLQVTENEQSLEVADLLYKIASCHESLCEYDEALGIFEEVKQIRQTLTGIESSPVIKAMLRIGNVQLSRGEAQLALDCFNEIVGIGYASDSINGIEVANALYGRGCAQYCLFQLSDAMKSLNESLNWKLAALGEDNPGLACIFYQMAHVYLEQSEEEDAILCFEEYVRLLKIDQHRNLQDNAEICQTAGIVSKLKGEYDKALAFYDQALAMFETLFGTKPCHEKLATIHFDIGCIHALQGNNREALKQLQFCLAMRKKLFGTHVEVANVLYEMAVILQQEDMIKPAVMCLEESDSIWKTKLGSSEKLISVCHVSGKLWKSLLRYEEAGGNFEKALELAITLHGRCHDTVATILVDLGELLHEIGQYEQALFCYDESLDVRTQIFGPDDLTVAAVLYCKGVALLFQGNFDAAYECLNRSLIIRQEKLGDVNNDVGDTLNTIGFLQLRKGNIAEDSALTPLTKALEVRRALGNMSKVVSTLQNLASLYKKRKEFDLCMEIHSEILAVRQEEFGTNDEKVAEAWINLGNIQTTAGRMVEATISYEEALRIRTLSSGYNHKSVAHVLFKLGLLNLRQNNYDNAQQIFEEYIRLRAEEENDPDQEMAQALTLIGDIQLETGEKSKAQINWISATEIYSNLGYPEDHPKVLKLKLRQKAVPTFGLFAHRRMSDVSRVASDLSSVVDAPLSLLSRLAGIPSDMPESTENNVCVNH